MTSITKMHGTMNIKLIELNILQYGKTVPVPYSHTTGEFFSEYR